MFVLQTEVFGAFFALMFVFALLFFAIHIGMVVWTYSDAGRNSTDAAALWALVVFFGMILGFVLYFIIGRDQA